MNSKHDDMTKFIALKPSIIGIEGIVLSTGESNIFRGTGLYHQPDSLLFDPWTRKLYQVEYKCTDDKRHCAIVQLNDCKNVLKNIFPNYTIISLYVHGDMVVETIK